jgi:hypothetical protein
MMSRTARRLACAVALAAAPSVCAAATTTGNCTFDTATHWAWYCDSAATRGQINGIGDPGGTSHSYGTTAGCGWQQVTMLTSLSCSTPANFADYTVNEQSVARLFTAIVGLLALAATVRLIRDVIRGRR